jgi:hypothetical protein
MYKRHAVFISGKFFRQFDDEKTVSYEPQVDPLGNLEIIKKGEQDSEIYIGDAKATMVYVSPPWALEITEVPYEQE